VATIIQLIREDPTVLSGFHCWTVIGGRKMS